MAARSGKEPPNAVQLNQLMCERVRKELRCQKLHTEYGVNPLQRGEAVRPAPRSHKTGAEAPRAGHGWRRAAGRREGAGGSRAPTVARGADGGGASGRVFFYPVNPPAHSETARRHSANLPSLDGAFVSVSRTWNPQIPSKQHRAKTGQRAPTLHHVSSAPGLISTC